MTPKRMMLLAFLLLVVLPGAWMPYAYQQAVQQAKEQGAAEEREAILAWMDGLAKGMISIGHPEEAKTLNSINGLIRANAHYEFRKTIAELDAQHRVEVTP